MSVGTSLLTSRRGKNWTVTPLVLLVAALVERTRTVFARCCRGTGLRRTMRAHGQLWRWWWRRSPGQPSRDPRPAGDHRHRGPGVLALQPLGPTGSEGPLRSEEHTSELQSHVNL